MAGLPHKIARALPEARNLLVNHFGLHGCKAGGEATRQEF